MPVPWLRPSGSVTVSRPIQRVFGYYLSPIAWAPSPRFHEISRPPQKPLGVGDQFSATYQQAGQNVETHFEVREVEHPRRVVVSFDVGDVTQLTTVTLESTATQDTVLTMSMEMRGTGCSLLNPTATVLLPVMMRLAVGRTLRGERQRIESLER